MMHPSSQTSIPLEEINFDDTSYKITKPHISEQLIQSIKKHGIVEPPVLIRQNNRFIILSGHNRLSAAKALGRNRQACRILEAFEPELFFDAGIKKLYHNEIGPIGKIRFYQILKPYESDLSIRNSNLFDFAVKELGIHAHILSSDELISRISSFPPLLIEYLEMKDPGFKTMRDLVHLSDTTVAIVSSWIESIPMRINIFRQIVELLYDIELKVSDCNRLHNILIPIEGDPRHKEALLLQSLMAIRYPNFLKRKSELDTLMMNLQKNGVQTEFPQFFEGDEVSFTIDIRKKEGSNSFFKKIEKIDKNTVEKLLNLL